MSRIVLSLLSLLWVGSVQAAPVLNYGFLSNTAFGKFSKADLAMMSDEITRSLDGGADGQTVEWRNEKTTSGGSVTPAADPQNRPGCRAARVVTLHRTLRGEGDYLFCKSKGRWRVVSPL